MIKSFSYTKGLVMALVPTVMAFGALPGPEGS